MKSNITLQPVIHLKRLKPARLPYILLSIILKDYPLRAIIPMASKYCPLLGGMNQKIVSMGVPPVALKQFTPATMVRMGA
jgi:hypothetical protein